MGQLNTLSAPDEACVTTALVRVIALTIFLAAMAWVKLDPEETAVSFTGTLKARRMLFFVHTILIGKPIHLSCALVMAHAMLGHVRAIAAMV